MIFKEGDLVQLTKGFKVFAGSISNVYRLCYQPIETRMHKKTEPFLWAVPIDGGNEFWYTSCEVCYEPYIDSRLAEFETVPDWDLP